MTEPHPQRRRAVILTAPDGNTVVWARLRPPVDEGLTILRARDWARRMYGQSSPVVETVRVADVPNLTPGVMTGEKNDR